MKDLFSLAGKVAIITGASRGIGQAIAEVFAQAGAQVVVSSRKQEGIDPVAEAIRADGGEAAAIVAHNGDKAALTQLVTATVERFGRVDILVNNAATNPHFGPMLEAEDSLWHKTIEVNIMGNVWLTQAVVPLMRANGGGKIVNIASVNGVRPGHLQGIYSMTKAAIINLTQTLAMELAGDNIQVNAIAPGLTQTRFAQGLWDDEGFMAQLMTRIPQQRIGQPIDMAGLALYLAAPASAYATGQVFVVDGGMTIPLL